MTMVVSYLLPDFGLLAWDSSPLAVFDDGTQRTTYDYRLNVELTNDGAADAQVAVVTA